MKRHIQADNAFIKWMEAMSKNVVHIADAWYAAVKWADEHPDIDVRTMAAWQSGYQAAIEKACEWLEMNVVDIWSSPCNPEKFVEQLRKAMNED